MKKYSLITLMLLGLGSTAFAGSEVNEAWKDFSANRDATINIYGVGAKTDEDQSSHGGLGVMFDSEAIKLKFEGTSDFIKTGAVLKLNPFDNKWYIKVGTNYINQKMYAPDDTNDKVDQYSGALATGYMFMDDLYVEVGGSYTSLNGTTIGNDYEVKDEETSLAYLEVAKRWELAFGTIDTSANAGEVFHEYSDDEFSYGVGVDYYPTNNSKLGYNYQNEENNIVSTYSAQYGYAFAEYIDNLSADIYQVNAGVKIAFTDIANLSTYTMPKNIKPHLSELHRFENIAFSTNMDIQSSAGVSQTAEAAARDANSSPVLSGSTSTGDIDSFENITNISLDIADDNLALVTWTLSYTSPGIETGTFSQTVGTGNTLSGITFTPSAYGSTGWTVKATVVDSSAGTTQTVVIYSN